MNTSTYRTFPYATSSAIRPSFRGDVSRHVGNIRTVILDRQTVNMDTVIGMALAVQESIEEAFGREEGDPSAQAPHKLHGREEGLC